MKDNSLDGFVGDTRCQTSTCLFDRLQRRSCRCWGTLDKGKGSIIKSLFQNPRGRLPRSLPLNQRNTCPSGRLLRGLRQLSRARLGCDTSGATLPLARSLGERTSCLGVVTRQSFYAALLVQLVIFLARPVSSTQAFENQTAGHLVTRQQDQT